MAKLWRYGSEQAWLDAINGDSFALDNAFEWASTEEGEYYWSDLYRSQLPLPKKVRDRVAYLYAEWKLVGDTNDRAEEDSTGENG